MTVVTPLHAHFSPDHLEHVVAEMRQLGPPRIRAHYDQESQMLVRFRGHAPPPRRPRARGVAGHDRHTLAAFAAGARECAVRCDRTRARLPIRHGAVILLGVFFTSADRALLQQIADRQDQIMSKLDDLATTEQNLEAKTDALLAFAAAQQTSIADLQAQLAAAGNIDPAVQAVIDRMTAEAAKVAAFLSPPAPSAPSAK